jgi:3-hydroxybutyryl-CoA dehydrogenase
MQIIVHSDDILKDEFIKQGVETGHDIQWIHDPTAFNQYTSAEAWMDLKFEASEERISILSQLKNGVIIINSVVDTLTEINKSFARVNGWRTFLSSAVLEGAAGEPERRKAEKVLHIFQKKIHWLPDEPGFISARVVSMVINEAFIALNEKVSTKEEINTAMKLGTNYPYGPFEWVELIGVNNVRGLLLKLSVIDEKYTPSW